MSKVIIGRGGFGEIFYYRDKPKTAYKESFGRCKDLQHEYQMWKKAYNAFITYTNSKKSLRKSVCILRPSEWRRLPNERCIFKMARIVPLNSGSKYTWQAYMGNTDDPDMDKVIKVDNKIRGRYMGPNTLSKYFDVDSMAFQGGQLIGIIHYCAHLDATDTELVVGKLLSKDSPCRLFLIDYDQVREWSPSDPENEIVNRLSWSISAEPYWPDKDSPYHDSFRKGYLKSAKTCGYEALAEKVLRKM